MNAVSNIRLTGTQISRGLKVHVNTCESKVQVVVSTRELVSFICPRELERFNPWHVTRSPPIGELTLSWEV